MCMCVDSIIQCVCVCVFKEVRLMCINYNYFNNNNVLQARQLF